MKLYLGKFTLEGTPQEIKEVLDLMGIKYEEIPNTIPTYPTIPDPIIPYSPHPKPEPWSPYDPNFWWWHQPTCVAQDSKANVATSTNSAEVKMTEKEWEDKKLSDWLDQWNKMMEFDINNCTGSSKSSKNDDKSEFLYDFSYKSRQKENSSEK